MKKLVSFVLILSLTVLSLCGCAAQEKPAANLPNPLESVSADQLAAQTGLTLNAPDGAEDVSWQIIKVDAPIAQMQFKLDGVRYTYRAQPTASLEASDISGLNYSWTQTGEAKVRYLDASFAACDQAAVIYWLDIAPGIAYSLGAADPVSIETLTDVANKLFAPVQESADGMTDYTGVYESDDSSSVIFTPGENGFYNVEIGIFRLATFTGTGNDVDGAVEVELTDPNGGKMYGNFHPAEDGGYTLTITQSEWNLVEDGTEFTGFFPVESK